MNYWSEQDIRDIVAEVVAGAAKPACPSGCEPIMAHLIANPNPEIYKKLGVIGECRGAIGILTITPSEAAIIGADVATKAANVEIVFVDRFNGSLVINGDVASVEAAMGLPTWKVILRHIIPNCLSPIIVQVTLAIGSNIIAASSLSFLGVGVAPPMPEWGAMLSDSRQYIRSAPWMCIFPGLAIVVTVLALNLMGDGLRDALDPKLKK